LRASAAAGVTVVALVCDQDHDSTLLSFNDTVSSVVSSIDIDVENLILEGDNVDSPSFASDDIPPQCSSQAYVAGFCLKMIPTSDDCYTLTCRMTGDEDGVFISFKQYDFATKGLFCVTDSALGAFKSLEMVFRRNMIESVNSVMS